MTGEWNATEPRMETGAVQPMWSRVLTWVLMVPLFCYACDGLLWFRTAGAGDVLSATYGQAAGGGSGTVDNTAVLLVLLVTLSAPLLFRLRATMRQLWANPVFLLLGGWVAVSFLWSQLPLVSLEWTPAALLVILAGAYVSVRFQAEEQFRLILLLGTICLVMSYALSLGSASYRGGNGEWRGMYAQKNMCCMVTEFLLTPAFYVTGRGMLFRVYRAAYVVLSVLLIVLTKSSTGRLTLALLLGFVVLTKVLPRLNRPLRRALLLGGAAVTVVLATIGMIATAEIAQLFGKDPTLTGRTDIWLAMIPSLLKHPLVGYGYRAFWRGYQGESAYISLAAHWAVPSAHNAILEVAATLGGVGVALILFSLFKACVDGFRCLVGTESPQLAWYASIVALMLFISLDEAEMLSPYGLMWMLYVFACLGLSDGARRLRKGRLDGTV